MHIYIIQSSTYGASKPDMFFKIFIATRIVGGIKLHKVIVEINAYEEWLKWDWEEINFGTWVRCFNMMLVNKWTGLLIDMD